MTTSPAAVEIRLVGGQSVIVAPSSVARVEPTDNRRGLVCSRLLFSSGLAEYVVGAPAEVAQRLFGSGFVPLAETEEQQAELAAAEKRKPKAEGASGKKVNRVFNHTETSDPKVLV